MDRRPLNLPSRFELHGVVGRGSQAVVWLATDTLRGERVALKVFADPTSEVRLRREVKAASLVRSDAVLLPHDVHAFDGGLALSMPFHAGRTLADRVHESGPLPPGEVRVLAERLSRALAAAHGAGVLHRDVSPNNVLASDGCRDAVLADFGSARTLAATATRSTVGTLGYVAPELLGGRRADVRSDLYGLGATLYFAATGASPAVDGLAAQVAGRVPPVRARVPAFPEGLARAIEGMLAAAPEDRPDGAAAVGTWLSEGAPGVALPGGDRQFLPPGRWRLVLHERRSDRDRRASVRKRHKEGDPPTTAWDELSRWGRHLADQVRDNLGVPEGRRTSPEDQVVAAVAAEAGVLALRTSPVVWRPRFVLVAGVEEACAQRLAEAARLAGFRAQLVEEQAGWGPRWVAAVWWSIPLLGWALTVWWSADPTLAIVATVLAAVFGGRVAKAPAPTDAGPVAYDVDLSGALTASATPRFPRAVVRRALPAPASPPPSSRGERLRLRAQGALDALSTAAREHPTVPVPFRDDVLQRVAELAAEAKVLAARVDALEVDLGARGAPAAELDRLRARRDRLETLKAAGEAVPRSEIEAIDRALAQHRADDDAASTVESHLARATAQLVEIAATASRIRRELQLDGETPEGRVTADLRAQVDAMRRTAREVAGRSSS